MHRPAHLLAVLALCLSGLIWPHQAHAADKAAQTAWRLLDYLAVDYAGAVADGTVIDEAEYAEMMEFAGSARERIAALPPNRARDALSQGAERLQAVVMQKAPPAQVADLARGLADALLAAYPVPLAPSAAPAPDRGRILYAERCASCHGAAGAGDGPAAASLDPPPIAFTDRERARERSVFALYQVILQGVEGTSMPGFPDLPAEDRWALAFHISGMAYTGGEAQEGERLWRDKAGLRQSIPTLEALTRATPAALAGRVGEAQAVALMAYLRRHPEVVMPGADGSLALARRKLTEATAAYEAGHRRDATDLALSAYLDGFEPMEPMLAIRDATLMARIEGAMGELRARISRGSPVEEVRAQVRVVDGLFGEAEDALAASQATPLSTFIGAFAILLREGLEALLIVVAIIGFLRKTGRTDLMPFVHGGWAAALAAGALTWFAATTLISISGAGRELTEGLGSLLAAAVLLSVGIWMHGKSRAEAWKHYVQATMARALSRRSAWFLFLLSFIVVYREAFETILFYAALWSQGDGGAILAGISLALVVLAVIAWSMLRLSQRLPIERFFAWSSVLMAVLAVVLVGKGIMALQEAGVLGVQPLAAVPRLDLLGIHPTLQGTVGQVLAAAVILAAFWYNRRSAAPLAGRRKI
ncbi:FTR1 family protein [Siccirubricoccus sp. G192]|uniref:FTR1 family protein n=1 Tax=Siccirubricoccus sp. G192 TaxID=2849651 RepID=UPI001C2BD5E9|nr:FTR1 family protein [Siccirubricoccus sp. G192]MBV1797604.1 FTR1 family protein [Siccirubricoccus sp. G192]